MINLNAGKLFCQIISESEHGNSDIEPSYQQRFGFRSLTAMLQSKSSNQFCQTSTPLDINKINNKLWDKIIYFADNNGLCNLLFYKISLKKIDCPQYILDQLRKNYLYSLTETKTIENQVRFITTELNKLEIRHILLKGAHLTEKVYPQSLPLRTMCDIDILIDKDDFPAIKEHLCNSGYNVDAENHDGSYKILNRHFPGLRKTGTPPIEFHWILKKENDYNNIKNIYRRAQNFSDSISLSKTFVLSPEDLIIFLCYHKIDIDHFIYGLKTLYDISEVIKCYKIDYNKLISLASSQEEWNCRKSLFLCLLFTKKLINDQIPEEPITELRPENFNEKIESAVTRLLFNDLQYNKKIIFLITLIQEKSLTLLFSKLFIRKKEASLIYNVKLTKTNLIYTYAKRISTKFMIYTYVLFYLIFSGRGRKNIKLAKDMNYLINWLKTTS